MLNSYDFVHMTLLAVGGKVRGTTKLQKTIYFLGVLTRQLNDLGYRPYFYGPYSDEVADAMVCLKSLGFLGEQIVDGGAINQLGFEVARHDFHLNKDGKAIAKDKIKKYPQLWNKIKQAVSVLKNAGDIDYMDLSIAAKTYFMLGEKWNHISIDELAALTKKIGWSVTPQQVKNVARFMKKLDLDKKKL